LKITGNHIIVWLNDVIVFNLLNKVDTDKFVYEPGSISIGAGAGEVGGIAFEFDNIEIRGVTLISRWFDGYSVPR